jgi:hypothetical protein
VFESASHSEQIKHWPYRRKTASALIYILQHIAKISGSSVPNGLISRLDSIKGSPEIVFKSMICIFHLLPYESLKLFLQKVVTGTYSTSPWQIMKALKSNNNWSEISPEILGRVWAEVLSDGSDLSFGVWAVFSPHLNPDEFLNEFHVTTSPTRLLILLKVLLFTCRSTPYSLDDRLFQRLLNLLKDENIGHKVQRCLGRIICDSFQTFANTPHTILMDLIMSNLEGAPKGIQQRLLSVLGRMKNVSFSLTHYQLLWRIACHCDYLDSHCEKLLWRLSERDKSRVPDEIRKLVTEADTLKQISKNIAKFTRFLPFDCLWDVLKKVRSRIFGDYVFASDLLLHEFTLQEFDKQLCVQVFERLTPRRGDDSYFVIFAPFAAVVDLSFLQQLFNETERAQLHTDGYKMMSGNIMMSADRMKKSEANERIDPPASS